MNNSQTLIQRALAAHQEAENTRRSAHLQQIEEAKRVRLEMIAEATRLSTDFVQARLGAQIDAESVNVQLAERHNSYADVTFTIEGLPFACHVQVPNQGSHSLPTRLFYYSSSHQLTQISDLVGLGQMMVQAGVVPDDPTAASEAIYDG